MCDIHTHVSIQQNSSLSNLFGTLVLCTPHTHSLSLSRGCDLKILVCPCWDSTDDWLMRAQSSHIYRHREPGWHTHSIRIDAETALFCIFIFIVVAVPQYFVSLSAFSISISGCDKQRGHRKAHRDYIAETFMPIYHFGSGWGNDCLSHWLEHHRRQKHTHTQKTAMEEQSFAGTFSFIWLAYTV